MLIPCAIGYGQIIVIVLVVILLFGGKKIPELMRGLGRGVTRPNFGRVRFQRVRAIFWSSPRAAP